MLYGVVICIIYFRNIDVHSFFDSENVFAYALIYLQVFICRIEPNSCDNTISIIHAFNGFTYKIDYLKMLP